MVCSSTFSALSSHKVTDTTSGRVTGKKKEILYLRKKINLETKNIIFKNCHQTLTL